MFHNSDRKELKRPVAELRSYFAGVVLILVSFMSLPVIFGQEVANPAFTLDSRMRGTLRVDPATRSLQFSLMLGNYRGRGGSFPVVLNYSSKVWAFSGPSRGDRTPHVPEEGPYNYIYLRGYAEDTAAGWSSALDWIRFPSFTGNNRYDMEGRLTTLDPYSGQEQRMVARMYIRLPDGSKHELRRDDNVYDVTSCTAFCNGFPYYVYSPVNLSGTFYSVNGTRMKYVTSTNTLWMPDGSRYVFVGSASNPESVTRYDVNGNTLVYNYANDTWTDTMGRILATPLPDPNQVGAGTATSPRTDVYQLPGLGNGTQTYTLRWKYLRDPNTSETVLSNPNQPLLYFGDRVSTTNCNLVESLFESHEPCETGLGGNDSKIILAGALFNPVVLAEIEIPNGVKYIFKYNVYGEIDKIIYPTGGYERFEHDTVLGITPFPDDEDATPSIYPQSNRGVTKHWVSPSGSGTDELLTQYSDFNVTNPDGTRVERKFQFGNAKAAFGFDSAAAGSILEERFYSSANQMMRRTLNSYATEGPRGGGHPNATRDSRPEKTISIIMEPDSNDALMTMSVNEFDYHSDLEYFAYLNVKRVKQYGYVVVSKTDAQNLTRDFAFFATYFNSQTPVHVTETDYLYDPTYKARGIISLPTETRVLNPSDPNDVLAKSQFVYDELT